MNMMKQLFLLMSFVVVTQVASAQKVFSVNYQNQADIKVFVVDYANQASPSFTIMAPIWTPSRDGVEMSCC